VRGCGGAGNLEQVLAVGRTGTVDELPARQESVRPVLRTRGQAGGPGQWRHSHARPHGVVASQHVRAKERMIWQRAAPRQSAAICAAGAASMIRKPGRPAAYFHRRGEGISQPRTSSIRQLAEGLPRCYSPISGIRKGPDVRVRYRMRGIGLLPSRVRDSSVPVKDTSRRGVQCAKSLNPGSPRRLERCS